MATRSTAPQPTASPNTSLQDLPFWYPILPVTLTALQQGVIATVQIDNDADFEWRWIVSESTGLYSVELTDNFTKRPLQAAPVVSSCIAGTAQLPFILPKPYLIRRTSSISAKFNDLSGGESNTIYFYLIGYKLAGS